MARWGERIGPCSVLSNGSDVDGERIEERGSQCEVSPDRWIPHGIVDILDRQDGHLQWVGEER